MTASDTSPRIVDVAVVLDSTTSSATRSLDAAVAFSAAVRARLTILDLCTVDGLGIASDPRSEGFAVDVRTALRLAGLDGRLIASGPDAAAWCPSLHSADVAILVGAQGGRTAGRDVLTPALASATTPLLLLPETAAPHPVPRRILVPWSSDRASARALRDALPVLCTADDVILLASRAGGDGADAAAHLSRVGVRVRLATAAGPDLAAEAERWAADLVVLGLGAPARWPSPALPPRVEALIAGGAVALLLSP